MHENEAGKLSVVGIGPGGYEEMTVRAVRALAASEVIVGYTRYVDLVRDSFPDKEFLTTGMGQEEERCRRALARAQEGERTALVCGGDAGVYGLSGLTLGLRQEYPGVEVEVIAGVTAVTAGAALLGAPLIHDFAVISLSDRLTPWEEIAERLAAAAEANFAVVLCNPGSTRRRDALEKACDILLQVQSPATVCGIAENIGRPGEKTQICRLGELREKKVDMSATVFVGNSHTEEIEGKMVTPRGYRR